MTYEIIFHPGALREFDKLPKPAQRRVGEIIDGLAEEPRPRGIIKLAGLDAYRVRAGHYRVAYSVKDERLLVLIVKVGHRGGIYKEIETIRQRLKG